MPDFDRIATFLVQLDEPAPQRVTVEYRTTDGSAIAGRDYEAQTGLLTFEVNQQQRTVEVPCTTDLVGEKSLFFTLSLFNSINAYVGAGTASTPATLTSPNLIRGPRGFEGPIGPANPSLSLLQYDGAPLQSLLDYFKPLPDYTALLAYTGRAKHVRITNTGVDGHFVYDSTLPNITDGGTRFRSATGVGAWRRLYDGIVDCAWWGATGDGLSTNDMPAIQAAHDVAAAQAYGASLRLRRGWYRVLQLLNWNQRKVVLLTDPGTVIDWGGVVLQAGTTDWMVRYSSEDSVEKASRGLWRGHGTLLVGPGEESRVNGILCQTAGNAAAAFVDLKGLSTIGFAKHIGIGNQSCFTTVEDHKFRQVQYQQEIAISIEGVENTGEGVVFINPVFGNMRHAVLNNKAGMSDGITLINPGVDYCKEAFALRYSMDLQMSKGHIEWQPQMGQQFSVTGNGCKISWSDFQLWHLHGPVQDYIGKATNVGLGGIFLKNMFVQIPEGWAPGVDGFFHPDSQPGSCVISEMKGYVGQEHRPGGLPQTLTPYRTNEAAFQGIILKSNVGDGSVLGLDTLKKYRGQNTTTIKTTGAGQPIQRQIRVPIAGLWGIPAASLRIRAEGFVTTQWQISASFLGADGQPVGEPLTTFANRGNSAGTDTFDFYYWYLQARLSPAARYMAFDIYAQPQASGEGIRTLYVADSVVNIL